MYQIAIYEYRNGPLIKDLSFIANSPKFQTNQYGFGLFTTFIDATFSENARLYRLKKVAHVEVVYGAKRLYEGRLEDVKLTDNGLELTAYGYIRAFTDLQCTDLWSSTQYDQFLIADQRYNAANKKDIFDTDTNDRLYASLNHGVTISGGPLLLYYIFAPNKASRKLNAASYIYNVRNRARLALGIGHQANPNEILVSTGVTGVTSVATSASGLRSDIVAFWPESQGMHLYFEIQISPPTLYLGENEDTAWELSNLRFGSTVSISGSRFYADEVIAYLASGVNTLNSTQLSASKDFIQSPLVDITDLSYEDITALDVVNMLLEKPDNQNRLWECKVFFDGIVRFQPKGYNARTWYVDIGEFDVTRVFDKVSNKVRVKYDEDKRTSYIVDTSSIVAYGITRESSGELNTTSLTSAQLLQSALLDERKDNQVQSGIQTRWIRDEKRTLRSSVDVRSGDTVIIGNLPPNLFDTTLTQFTVLETEYDLETGINTIVPDRSNPVLDVLLSRITY